MILAAGLGTRLKPFTDKHPKALAQVNGKSLLQRNVEYLRRFDITDIIVNVHHFAEQIIADIAKNKGWGTNISISDESDEVLETGGGLKKAAPFFSGSGDFVLMNADILTDLNLSAMEAAHRTYGALATLAVSDRTTSRYLLFDQEQRLRGRLNTKTGETQGASGSKKAFSGVHIINERIFPLIEESGKFSVIDLYLRLCNTEIIKGHDHSGGKFADAGSEEKLREAETLFY